MRIVNGMDVIYRNIFEEFTDSQYKKVSYNLKDHKRIYLIVYKFLKDNLKRKIGDEMRLVLFVYLMAVTNYHQNLI